MLLDRKKKDYICSNCINILQQTNLIEPEWYQIKTYELAGRIFDDEYDLVLAVIDGV